MTTGPNGCASPEQRGRSIYTSGFLTAYDPMLRVTCPLVWHCPRQAMVDLYCNNAGMRHLDIGPGTGYFLDKCNFPGPEPSIALVDNSMAVLDRVTSRIARYRPTVYFGDALDLDLGTAKFESAGLLNLLHCLPGDMAYKCTIFDRITDHMDSGGRIFGSSLLGPSAPHGHAALALIKLLNRAGIFHNADDSLDSLRAELGKRFSSCRLRAYGSMALFEVEV
jgi:hypothetical protein